MQSTSPPPDAAEWACDGQADLLDELDPAAACGIVHHVCDPMGPCLPVRGAGS